MTTLWLCALFWSTFRFRQNYLGRFSGGFALREILFSAESDHRDMPNHYFPSVGNLSLIGDFRLVATLGRGRRMCFPMVNICSDFSGNDFAGAALFKVLSESPAQSGKNGQVCFRTGNNRFGATGLSAPRDCPERQDNFRCVTPTMSICCTSNTEKTARKSAGHGLKQFDIYLAEMGQE